MGIFVACVTRCSNYLLPVVCILPMAVDGGIQLVFKKESNNFRRLITGILGGIGIVYFFISLHMFTVWWLKLLLKC